MTVRTDSLTCTSPYFISTLRKIGFQFETLSTKKQEKSSDSPVVRPLPFYWSYHGTTAVLYLHNKQHCSFTDINECAILNGECAHNCTDLAVGRACWCRAGWRRARGGTACEDVDECAEDDPCDQRCQNTVGSFVCHCAPGYRLLPDGITCTPVNSKYRTRENYFQKIFF